MRFTPVVPDHHARVKVRQAADKSLPYDGLPILSKGTTDKDVRRTEGKFISAARLTIPWDKPDKPKGIAISRTLF